MVDAQKGMSCLEQSCTILGRTYFLWPWQEWETYNVLSLSYSCKSNAHTKEELSYKLHTTEIFKQHFTLSLSLLFSVAGSLSLSLSLSEDGDIRLGFSFVSLIHQDKMKQ